MWYRYRVSGDQLLDSLQNKRITGFRLRWRVENPAAMMATLTKPGSWIKTPRLGQCNFSGSYFKANHTYKATLQFPSDLVRLVGSGVLVVKLIADTGKEMEGLLENVKLFERARYSLYTEIKKWEEARVHCQKEGGHLAHVLPGGLSGLGGNILNVWVGGKKGEDGVWHWTNGTLMEEVDWGNDDRDSPLCLNFAKGAYAWRDSCTAKLSFFCESNLVTILSGNTTLRYEKEKVTFSSIELWYQYGVPSHQLVQSLEDKIVNGFKLSWWIEEQNGSTTSELRPDSENTCRAMAGPSFRDNNLNRMVELAKTARLVGLAEDEVVKRAIQDKYYMEISGAIDYSECSNNLVRVSENDPFEGITLALADVMNEGDKTVDNIRTCFSST